MKRTILLLVAAVVCCLPLMAQEHEQHEHMTPLKTSPEFEQIKKLVGRWEGKASGIDHTTAEFRMTGGGSAIMMTLATGTPYEMVTMFTMDGDRLIATHYCASHNQPRMAAVPSKGGNSVEFKYVDGTNILPGYVHMDNVKMTLADADHHTEVWTSTENGKSDSMQFDFHRVQ